VWVRHYAVAPGLVVVFEIFEEILRQISRVDRQVIVDVAQVGLFALATVAVPIPMLGIDEGDPAVFGERRRCL
jgi:hypothetical protein